MGRASRDTSGQRYPGYPVTEADSARRRVAHRRSIPKTAREGEDWEFGTRGNDRPRGLIDRLFGRTR